MIKQLKYALMALSLLAGMKLVQVLFIDQKPKKKFYPKVELVENGKTAKKPKVSQTKVDTVKKTEIEAKPDSTFEAVVEKDQANIASVNTSYPTLEDLKTNYISVKNAVLQDGRSREDVVVRYYKHEKDGDKVYALKSLRYYLHEKPATETQGLGSNVLYYGNEVNLEDIQVVAYVLLENGIPLKSIERSKYDWKSNAIEIGTDPDLIGKENITKDKIRDFSL